jgi:hypothetical protein
MFTLGTVANLPAATQEQLAKWLLPAMQTHPDAICPLLNRLADQSSTARQALLSQAETLPSSIQQEIGNQLLRFQPIQAHPPLSQLAFKDQRFLIALYQQQASEHPAARAKLLTAALGRQKEAAVAATHDLAQVCGDHLTPSDLLPLLRSRFVGVRANGLLALSALNKGHADTANRLLEDSLIQIGQILSSETNPTVVRHFCDLSTDWIQQQNLAPPTLLPVLDIWLARMANQGDLEGGLGRSMALLLKAIARSEDPRLDIKQLNQVVQRLLTAIPMTQLKNGEVEAIDILCALHRLDPTVLATLIDQMLPELLRLGWLRNAASIIKAARKLEGPQSPQLDIVMRRYGSDAAVESLVLEARGA